MGIAEVIVMVIVMILAITATVLSMVLQRVPMPAMPESATSIEVPQAKDGQPVPQIFGRVWIKNASVAWYGDFQTWPIPYRGPTGGNKK